MSHQLYLFAQLPINTPFTFEGPDNPLIYIKTSESRACSSCNTDGCYKTIPVSPSVLVFPILEVRDE